LPGQNALYPDCNAPRLLLPIFHRYLMVHAEQAIRDEYPEFFWPNGNFWDMDEDQFTDYLLAVGGPGRPAGVLSKIFGYRDYQWEQLLSPVDLRAQLLAPNITVWYHGQLHGFYGNFSKSAFSFFDFETYVGIHTLVDALYDEWSAMRGWSDALLGTQFPDDYVFGFRPLVSRKELFVTGEQIGYKYEPLSFGKDLGPQPVVTHQKCPQLSDFGIP
jgi:hypothetical protein